MLGVFESFPENVHKIVEFTTTVSNRNLQKNLTKAFRTLNCDATSLQSALESSTSEYTAVLEFGIAEANSFNYLDDEEMVKVLKIIQKKPLQVMDFYCVARYYKTQYGKKAPLKFDYYMLRLSFDKNLTEMRLFHDRGPMRMLPDEVADLIARRINETFHKRVLTRLES